MLVYLWSPMCGENVQGILKSNYDLINTRALQLLRPQLSSHYCFNFHSMDDTAQFTVTPICVFIFFMHIPPSLLMSPSILIFVFGFSRK